jgi:hypothetical protein
MRMRMAIALRCKGPKYSSAGASDDNGTCVARGVADLRTRGDGGAVLAANIIAKLQMKSMFS